MAQNDRYKLKDTITLPSFPGKTFFKTVATKKFFCASLDRMIYVGDEGPCIEDESCLPQDNTSWGKNSLITKGTQVSGSAYVKDCVLDGIKGSTICGYVYLFACVFKNNVQVQIYNNTNKLMAIKNSTFSGFCVNDNCQIVIHSTSIRNTTICGNAHIACNESIVDCIFNSLNSKNIIKIFSCVSLKSSKIAGNITIRDNSYIKDSTFNLIKCRDLVLRNCIVKEANVSKPSDIIIFNINSKVLEDAYPMPKTGSHISECIVSISTNVLNNTIISCCTKEKTPSYILTTSADSFFYNCLKEIKDIEYADIIKNKIKDILLEPSGLALKELKERLINFLTKDKRCAEICNTSKILDSSLKLVLLCLLKNGIKDENILEDITDNCVYNIKSKKIIALPIIIDHNIYSFFFSIMKDDFVLFSIECEENKKIIDTELNSLKNKNEDIIVI